MNTVKDPKTGMIEYVPNWMLQKGPLSDQIHQVTRRTSQTPSKRSQWEMSAAFVAM